MKRSQIEDTHSTCRSGILMSLITKYDGFLSVDKPKLDQLFQVNAHQLNTLRRQRVQQYSSFHRTVAFNEEK